MGSSTHERRPFRAYRREVKVIATRLNATAHVLLYLLCIFQQVRTSSEVDRILRDRLEEAQSELKQARRTLGELPRENAELRERVVKLEVELSAARGELAQLKAPLTPRPLPPTLQAPLTVHFVGSVRPLMVKALWSSPPIGPMFVVLWFTRDWRAAVAVWLAWALFAGFSWWKKRHGSSGRMHLLADCLELEGIPYSSLQSDTLNGVIAYKELHQVRASGDMLQITWEPDAITWKSDAATAMLFGSPLSDGLRRISVYGVPEANRLAVWLEAQAHAARRRTTDR